MPIIELINHSPDGKQYLASEGVKFVGTFKGEVLASYHGSFDAIHFLEFITSIHNLLPSYLVTSK